MNGKILVSVIMPTYKVEEYLPQCLESVIAQDLTDIEIIPVDDGSPDSCGAIIDKYVKQDSRIHPIHQENGGYGKAINAGLKKAQGKYIAIVETDDFVEPDMLSSMYELAEEHQVNVVKAGFNKLYSDGGKETVTPPFIFYNSFIKVDPKYSNDLMVMESSIWAALYRRDFLIDNEIWMTESKGAAYQDGIFKFMVYSCTDTVLCMKKAVYNYRVMTVNSSSKSSKNWDAEFINYNIIKKWLVGKGVFNDFKDAFYLHGYFDFLFHFNRLDPESQKSFLKKGKEFYQEGVNAGIGKDNARFINKGIREYYYNQVYSFLCKLDEGIMDNSTETVSILQHCRNAAKASLRRVYHTSLGTWGWNYVNAILHRPFFWNKLHEGMQIPTYVDPNYKLSCLNFENGIFELEKPDVFIKKVLVILPWYSQNAAVHNIEHIILSLKNRGYQAHLFCYWEAEKPVGVNERIWDRVFYKKAENPYFSHTNFSKYRPDGDRIDDWVDDDFLQSIIRLQEHYNYSVCIANYLFYTKAFEVLPSSVRKVLYTHDKFVKHNQSLHEAGFPEWSFWFGVETEKEERRALLRADVVLASQENDCSYFKKITTNLVPVITFPFIPEQKFLPKKQYEDSVLKVGYIASSNPPNYFAINKLIRDLRGNNDIKLCIAGNVCEMFDEKDIPQKSVVLYGKVESIEEFYSECDIYVNPDTFYSGLKCKTLEAIAYGVGIICTEVASTGIPMEQEYHLLKDEKACADYLLKIAKLKGQERISALDKFRAESRKIYSEFGRKYEVNNLIDLMLTE